MIKLKTLLTEAAGQITPESLKNYWNFALNALSGHNPDGFYRQHRRDIDAIAEALVKKYGPTSGGTAFRGIMLDPSEVHNGKVNHVDEITYVSFSEDKDIAIAFGDVENDMWSFGKTRYPKKQGYLITADWRPEHLLFHHKWLSDAGMWPMVIDLFGDHAKYMELQKELILKPKPYYRVVPVPPGASGNRHVGME